MRSWWLERLHELTKQQGFGDVLRRSIYLPSFILKHKRLLKKKKKNRRLPF